MTCETIILIISAILAAFAVGVAVGIWSSHESDKVLSNKLDSLLGVLKYMANEQDELAVELDNVTAQIAKIGVETGKTLQKVIDLEAVIASGGSVSQKVKDSLAALKAQAQKTDDLTPDSDTETTTLPE